MANAKDDFSKYDHVIVIHAGAGQETDVAGDSPIQLWSSFYDLSDIRSVKHDPSLRGLATTDSLNGEPFFVDNFSIVPSHASQDFATVGTLASGRSRSEAASVWFRSSIPRRRTCPIPRAWAHST